MDARRKANIVTLATRRAKWKLYINVFCSMQQDGSLISTMKFWALPGRSNEIERPRELRICLREERRKERKKGERVNEQTRDLSLPLHRIDKIVL